MFQNNISGLSCKQIIIIFVALALSGCDIGTKKVLFMTKTSLGVDIDSSPPTFDVAFDRKEGTIAPVFDDGQVLSQLASFSSQQGIMNQAVGQSFATGTAAELMSKYLLVNSSLQLDDAISMTEVKANNPLTRTGEPQRYFFGTDTCFGLRINFGAESGWMPNALNIGYKRKELAYVPLIEKQKVGGAVDVSLPSLLATFGYENKVSAASDDLLLHQFFATGLSANYLASIPRIRQEIGTKIIPEAKTILFERGKDYAKAEKQEKIKNFLGLADKLPNNVAFDLNKNIPVSDSQANIVVNQMDPTCLRLQTRDCNDDGVPDAGGPGAVGSADVARKILKFRIVMSGNRSDDELNAWEAALKSVK